MTDTEVEIRDVLVGKSISRDAVGYAPAESRWVDLDIALYALALHTAPAALNDAIFAACDRMEWADTIYGLAGLREVSVALRAARRTALAQPAAPADGLDAAWAEAEAALPEGWRIDSVQLGVMETAWWARAWPARGGTGCVEHGPTPAAALRALAAKLRERAG